MINYNKNNEGMFYVPRFEYRERCAQEEQIRQLERLIEVVEEEYKASGYRFEPDIKVSELKRIFNIKDKHLPFEIKDDDIDNLTADDLADVDSGYQE